MNLRRSNEQLPAQEEGDGQQTPGSGAEGNLDQTFNQIDSFINPEAQQ
jgi:hypothetical protein